MRKYLALLGVALICPIHVRAQIAPGQVIEYPNGYGFINDDGIPEYRPKLRPKKKKSPPKKITRIPLGNGTVLYPHSVGYIDSNGTAVLESLPTGFFDAFVDLVAFPFGHYTPPPPPPPSPLDIGISQLMYWINCVLNYFFTGAFQVTSDKGNSAGFLGGLSALFFTTSYDSNANQLVIHSPDQRFDGLTGNAAAVAGGFQFTFTGTRNVNGNDGTKITVSFFLPTAAPGQSQAPPTSFTVSMLAPADAAVGATVWTATSSFVDSNNVAGCNGPATAGEPVAMHTGEYLSDPDADLSLGGPLPVEFTRHYGSLLKNNLVLGAMGDNWMHNFELKLAVSGSTATVTLFGGATMQFTKSGSNWSLAQKQPYAYQFLQNGSNFQFLDAQVNLIYTFNAAGQLIGMQDRNGNTLTITQSGPGPALVADGLGRSLTFAYSPAGNLTSVKDQTGRTVTFTYAGGTVATVVDANNKVTAYGYTSVNTRTGLLATVKRPAGNTTLTQTFDTQARALRQLDGLNNATTFVYDNPTSGSGTLTDPLGNKTRYDHADSRNNTTITDANGKVTTIVYDAAGHPIQITDPLGNKTIVTYDPASGLPTSVTDAAGNTTSAAYTAQIQSGFTFYVLTKLTSEDGTSTSYTFDANGNLLTITDPAGKVSQMTYNKAGQLLTSKNPSGGVTTYTYNADGTVAKIQSPAGDTTSFDYDAAKRVVKLTHPDGTTDTFAYDARSRVTQHTPAAGAPETFAYDDNGNLINFTGLNGGSSIASFDANDQPVSVKDPTGATSTVAYDATQQAKIITNGASEKTSLTLDPVGQPLAVLDSAGNGRHYVWSANGFPQSVTDALSKTINLTTDALGRITSVTTPLNEKTTIAYDKTGRPVSATTPLNHTVKFTYDAVGNLVRTDLPAGVTASYTRNELGLISSVTDPNGNTWKRSYDNMGRLASITDPLGQATTVQYDSLNRPSATSNPAGSLKLSRNALGNPTSAQFSDGTVLNYQFAPGSRLVGADNLALAYDANGQVVSSNGIAITRDGAGRISSITYAPGLTVTYKYNSVGDLTEVDDWAGGATFLQYDAAHRLASVNRLSGAATQYTRDGDGRLLGVAEVTPAGNYSVALTLDAEGKVVSANRSLPQLPQPAGGFNGFSFDAASQISGATYDALGRLLSDGLRTYTWDLASRLTGYTGVDGSAQFTYDGLGMRVSRTTADGEQDYVWNYAHRMPVLGIVRSGGADLRYYVYLPDGFLLYSIEAADNSRHYYHYDEAGSTAFLTDDTGAVTDAYGITPFGETVTQMGSTDNPFTFQGAYGVMQEGATSLYYMRARYYDSASSRFLSRDLRGSLNPRRLNPYLYALDNPVGYRDPVGLSAESGGSAAQVVANAVAKALNGEEVNEAQIYSAIFREGLQNIALGAALSNIPFFGFSGEYYNELGQAILDNPGEYLDFLTGGLASGNPFVPFVFNFKDRNFLEYLDYLDYGPTSLSAAVFGALLLAWLGAQFYRRKRLRC